MNDLLERTFLQSNEMDFLIRLKLIWLCHVSPTFLFWIPKNAKVAFFHASLNGHFFLSLPVDILNNLSDDQDMDIKDLSFWDREKDLNLS